MEHVAVMKKSFGFLEKILNCEKTIESRWLSTKVAPWDTVKSGEAVYFKNAGEPVTVTARVAKVVQVELSSKEDAEKLLKEYGQKLGLEGMSSGFVRGVWGKKYCILIFLKRVAQVQPFSIKKEGFGPRASWISVRSVSALKERK